MQQATIKSDDLSIVFSCRNARKAKVMDRDGSVDQLDPRRIWKPRATNVSIDIFLDLYGNPRRHCTIRTSHGKSFEVTWSIFSYLLLSPQMSKITTHDIPPSQMNTTSSNGSMMAKAAPGPGPGPGFGPSPGPAPTGTTICAWFAVAFGIVSCCFIGRRLLHDSNRIRWGCLIMAFLTLIVTVANGLGLIIAIHGVYYCDLICFATALFTDLMVVITLDLGRKFYAPEERVNGLYWASVVLTALLNMVILGSLIAHHLAVNFNVSVIIDHIGRLGVPVVIFTSIAYAFYPVVVIRTGVVHRSATVFAVGIWVLSGMFILSVLYTIPMVISAVEFYEPDDIQVASEGLLSLIIRIFPSSFAEPSFDNKFPIASHQSNTDDRHEIRLEMAIKLQDDQSTSVISKSQIVETV
ncbi:hypothetical protein BC938DRAFT_483398 [Jimgerdemannia flammicorona]|uniref:Uncharacterized protein n=1 Tax=Jimgerdemannia flammicorona TaxID=994334 RepID=A0A433QC41_9FUNG|nr:hypothetical protein BC938DRAFT_483398 [Jimgerdemannia flammicorona]